MCQLLAALPKICSYICENQANNSIKQLPLCISFHTHTLTRMHTHTHAHSHQLKEIWIENVSDAPDAKVWEECVPGKPMTVFSTSAHKVLVYSSASLLPLHPFHLTCFCYTQSHHTYSSGQQSPWLTHSWVLPTPLSKSHSMMVTHT